MQANDFDTEVDQLTYEEPKLGIPKNNSVSYTLFVKEITFSGKGAFTIDCHICFFIFRVLL